MYDVALALFAVTYLLLLTFPKFRAHIALSSAALFVVLGILPADQVLQAIDWNVILMLTGTMGVVSLFIQSRRPALIADLILERVPNMKWATICLAVFAGLISAFIDNVATVLIVAPVVSVIAIAVSSNVRIKVHRTAHVEDYFPTVLLAGLVLLLISASFVPNKPSITNGIISMSIFVIGLGRILLFGGDRKRIRKTLKEIDLVTVLLLAGLFVVIGGVMEAGVVNDLGDLFVKVSGDNLFLAYTLIVWASVLLSGATLGGNLTPNGASANITALGILRRKGYAPSAQEFMRIGVPFTLAAVGVGYVIIWYLWA